MPVRHAQLAEWFDLPRTDGETGLGRLKQALAQHGVNARGWRLYLDYGDALFEALGRPWVAPDWPLSSGPNAAVFLRLLAACEMDVAPPRPLITSLSDWGIPRDRLDLVPVHFFRAAWKAAVHAEYENPHPSDAIERFMQDEVVPLARWFFATGRHVDADANLLKAGWSALEREFREWRKRELHAREERSPAAAEWPPFVRSVECGGYRFVALASESALMVEGDEMAHCIGSYGDRCRSEMLRAFSVREKKSGARAATLTVSEVEPGSWNIDGLKGYRNADVPENILLSAYGVIRAFEDAYTGQPTLRNEFDRVRLALPQQRSVIFDDIPF